MVILRNNFFMLNQSNFNELSQKEWLLTNGIGGYASSSLSGANTRRYHGILVASFNPPTDRKVLVSKIEEKIITKEATAELSANQYPDLIHPQGYTHLQSFERYPLPKFIFQVGEAKLAKTIFMVQDSNTTILEYENIGTEEFSLELMPLYVFRDYHSLFHEQGDFDFYQEKLTENQFKIYAHFGAMPFYFGFSKGNFNENSAWFKNFEYVGEKNRGLDFREDAKSNGFVQCTLMQGEKIYLIFTTDAQYLDVDASLEKEKEIKRLESLKIVSSNQFLQDLAVSGDQFLVKRKSTDSYTLIAGYPWFTDWGRDTMIAMRGLTIAVGKKKISESIIRTFLNYLDKGMLPNRFPDSGEEVEYNTIDATLWLFVVLYEYYEQFKDKELIAEVFPKLTEILEYYRKGTRYDIHMNEMGLIAGGEGISQLTWMDARVGDYVVTPRHGCAVEINALWYNALCIYQYFAKLLKQKAGTIAKDITSFELVFRNNFLNQKGYLNDVVLPGQFVDDTIRPNQIYAISLPFSFLNKDESLAVLNHVEEHLYTDLGLRSLSPQHPDFKAHYGGDQWQRDTAYHQGTVWAFLWGEYALAYLKVHDFSEEAKNTIHQKMKVLENHFYNENCIYGISEIFDGAEPQAGKGCVQQAWSIGMLMKVLKEMGV